MWHSVVVAPLFLLIACAAPLPRVELPESGVEPTKETARPAPRTDGRSDGPAPRLIRVRFDTGKGAIDLAGWCREDVWTTLDQRAAIAFVSRESWSRLGEREPRRIAGTKDAVFQGAFVRLRPTRDGFVDFVAEISEARVGPELATYEWQGATIRLPLPHQDGFRFEGRASAGHVGEIARWGELGVAIEDSSKSTATSPTMKFMAGEPAGSVVGSVVGGRLARAERYRLDAIGREPVLRDHDGIVQALFRIRTTRLAAGIRFDAEQGWLPYGDDSLLVIDE